MTSPIPLADWSSRSPNSRRSPRANPDSLEPGDNPLGPLFSSEQRCTGSNTCAPPGREASDRRPAYRSVKSPRRRYFAVIRRCGARLARTPTHANEGCCVSQEAVERTLGKLVTDEAFRDRFFANAVAATWEAGLVLSPIELEALSRVSRAALIVFSGCLDRRISRLYLDNTKSRQTTRKRRRR